MKNIQNDCHTLKIKADYNFNKSIIYLSIVGIVFSLLILIQPYKLNLGLYSTILLIIPFLIINNFTEFKNNYLKYSNDLAKMIINFIGVYIFTCVFIFISLIILKLSDIEIVKLYFSNFIYFIPIFSVLIVLLLFTFFLKEGFKNFKKENIYYYVLFNIIFLCLLTVVFYIKISSFWGFLKWMQLMTFISIFHAINFVGICYFNKNNNFTLDEFSEQANNESIIAVFNILINFCLICFYFLLGMYLDNMLEKIKIHSLFILTWLFFFILIIKNFYQIKKIKNYLEWRNVVIA